MKSTELKMVWVKQPIKTIDMNKAKILFRKIVQDESPFIVVRYFEEEAA